MSSYSNSDKLDNYKTALRLSSTRSNQKTPNFPLYIQQAIAPKHFLHTPEEKQEFQHIDRYGYKYLPIELFKTEKKHYVFDSRNVAFLALDPVTYDVLSILRESDMTCEELSRHLQHIAPSVIENVYAEIQKLQQQGYLAPYQFNRACRFDIEEIEKALSEQLAGFTIFLTTQCNLACSYCIYGGQYTQHDSLSQSQMSWDTLKATMDFLEKHSRKSEEVRVDFFGGEPLLAFQLLKRGVEYLNSILAPSGRRSEITITSNGTVLSDKILDFMIDSRVYIQFSIDGSRDNHDKFRMFKKNKQGSFDKIMSNLAKIYKRSKEYYVEYVRIKGVLNTDTVAKQDTVLFDDPLIQPILKAGHFTFVELEPHYDVKKDHDYFERLYRLGQKIVKMKKLQNIDDIKERLNRKQANLFMHTFYNFFEYQMVSAVNFDGCDSTPFLKGCMPGYQQGSVKTNGDISVCLKAASGPNFVIGNVIQAEWYFGKIQQLNNILHNNWDSCGQCFLQKICELCYEKLDGREGELEISRGLFCEFNRKRYRIIISYMLRFMENNPVIWDDLQDRISKKCADTNN